MFKFVLMIASLVLSIPTYADQSSIELERLAKQYFDAWVATQQLSASEKEVDEYLTLLTPDVGHQHLPYDIDDERSADGRKKMREGMMFYLGAHTHYSAKLTSVLTGYNLVIIQYDTIAQGLHPETRAEVKLSYQTTEVLEIEDGKVSVIRKYSE